MANMIFNLDLNKNNAINPIIFGRLTDGNLRKITVNITNEGEPVDLTGWTIRFEGTTGGHAKIFDVLGVNILDAENGKFEYTFSKTAFSATGSYKNAYFAIEKGDMRETTNDIKIVVEKVADLDAQDAETVVTELNKTIALINQKYNELNSRVDVYESDIADLENWLDEQKAEINTIITDAETTFNQKLSEIQGKLDATNTAIQNGDFYSKTQTDSKIANVNGVITAHANNKNNPHSVTAGQVGAYTKAEVASIVTSAIAQAKLDSNPIGTILTTINNVNPSTYLGGTWQRFAQGRTLVGVDETDDVTLMKTANNQGGSVNPLTRHGHNISRQNGSTQSAIGASIGWSDLPNNAGVVKEAGDNTNHNNWQPFTTVYFWQRTA